jgi:alpha-tubulin suppressor-like RCC1 family protein
LNLFFPDFYFLKRQKKSVIKLELILIFIYRRPFLYHIAYIYPLIHPRMKTFLLLSLCLLFSSTVQSQTTWKMVSAGTEFGFALRSDSTLWCWGFNGNGQLGTGNPGTETPVQLGTEHNWINVSCGAFHTLAIKSDGTLWGWGLNSVGQISNNQVNQVDIPVQIGTDQDWVSINAGLAHSAAIKSNGTLWMWGYNAYGQLGNGSTSNTNVPTQVGTDIDWMCASLGGAHTLALKTNGQLFAWGFNFAGQLGNNTQVDATTPMQIGSATWKNVSAGYLFSCGVQTNGTAWSWGFNGNGQLGLGDVQQRLQPTQIGNGDTWDRILAGSGFSYGVTLDNQTWSWGYNGQGELGIGTQQQQTSPSLVATSFAPESNGFSTLALSVGATDASGSTLYGEHVIGIALDTYSICSTGANYQGQLGIGNTSSVSSFICGIGDLSAVEVIASSPINVYPNPASTELYVQIEDGSSTAILRDLSGRILANIPLTVGTNTIDIHTFSPGNYLVEINGAVAKFVVQ